MPEIFNPSLIKERMREKRISQDRLAQKLFVDRSTLNRWLNARSSSPDAYQLATIAGELGCKVSDFYAAIPGKE